MDINNNNLHQAIYALRKCSDENKDKVTDTFKVRTSDLCTDVANYLEKKSISNENLVKLCCKWLEKNQSKYIQHNQPSSRTDIAHYVSGAAYYVSGACVTDFRAFMNYCLNLESEEELFYEDVIKDYRSKNNIFPCDGCRWDDGIMHKECYKCCDD